VNEKEAFKKINQIWDVINDWADSSGTIKSVDAYRAICKVVTAKSDTKRTDKSKCKWSVNPESYCQTICKSDYPEDYKRCAEFWLLPRKTP